jgi:hypothetical protein
MSFDSFAELTGVTGLSEDEGAHGTTPITQRRVQAPGRAGVRPEETLHGLAKRRFIDGVYNGRRLHSALVILRGL